MTHLSKTILGGRIIEMPTTFRCTCELTCCLLRDLTMFGMLSLSYNLRSCNAWTSTAHKQNSWWALILKKINYALSGKHRVSASLSVPHTHTQMTCHLSVDRRISGLLLLGCFWKLSFRVSHCVLDLSENGHTFHQKIYRNCYLNTCVPRKRSISDLETICEECQIH